MQFVDLAKKLFQWNTLNLVATAKLKKDEIGQYFAESFCVKANGRTYDVDHENYFEFLNQFRSTIHSIQYDLQEFIVDRETVVIPLTAHITRTNHAREGFEAILILKFNSACKITLWHEVYVQT